MTLNHQDSASRFDIPDVPAFIIVTAAVVLSRLPFLSDTTSGLSSGLGSALHLTGFPWMLGLAGAIVFGVGCAFLGLALRSNGTKDPLLIAVVVSLLPAAYLNSIMPSLQFCSLTLCFAGLYFLARKSIWVGTVLMGLAFVLNALILPALFLLGPLARGDSVRTDALKRATLLFLVLVVAGLFVQVMLPDGVPFGVTFDRLSSFRLFRILTSEGLGVLAVLALAVCALSLFIHYVWRHMLLSQVSLEVAGVVLAGAGVFFFHPWETSLVLIALLILVASGRALPRALNRSALVLVAASPFLFMVTRIPEERTLFSGTSAELNVGRRNLYVDILQGPVLFEHAKFLAGRSAGVLMAGTGKSFPRRDAGVSTTPMWLTGYYPVWSLGITNGGINNPMYPHEMNWHGLTHVIHFNVGPDSTPPFWHPSTSHTMGLANTDSVEMFYGYGWRNNTSYHMIDSLRTYSHANSVKLLVSVGGIWGAQAGAMNYITGDSVRTQTFVSAAVAFAARNGYDGVEIDYEPPQSEMQMSRLTRIMKRRMSEVLGAGAPLVLAACTECCEAYALQLQDSIAQYNFMMYDMHQPYNGISSGGPNDPLDVTGYNSPLFPPDKERYPILNYWSHNYEGTRAGVPNALGPRRFMKLGFPPGKIGMGIPFYGYVYAGRNAPNQPRGGVWPQYLSYADCERALHIGGEHNWDDDAKVPWIGGEAKLDIGWMVKPGQEFYITYDDTTSLREKVRWARNLGLGGVMVYELWSGWVSTAPQGQKDPLLRSVVDAVASPK